MLSRQLQTECAQKGNTIYYIYFSYKMSNYLYSKPPHIVK